LAPKRTIGRRARLQGGLGFLSPRAQIPAIQAQWIKAYFARSALWTPILSHELLQLDEGIFRLARRFTKPTLVRVSPAWQFILEAWSKLKPHWDPDVSQWSDEDILAFPVPNTFSPNFPSGLLVSHIITYYPPSPHLELVSRDMVQAACPRSEWTRIWTAIERTRTSNTLVA